MNQSYLLAVATFAYGLHVLEEYSLDWKDWATTVLKLPVTWGDFYVVNMLVVVFGFSATWVGWRLPEFSLMFPALMLINGIFFHILPWIVTRRFSPGAFTAITLFIPIALWVYAAANQDGALTLRIGVLSFLGGALLMAFPVALLKLKKSL